MTAPLINTKLTIPPSRSYQVARTGLIERLQKGLQGRLTLVSAPPGYGKTTLLSEWTRLCGRPVAWISLDEGDSDPARFLAYLLAGLRTVAPELGEQFGGGRSDLEPVINETIMASLVNEIEALPERREKMTAGEILLVLDDYHFITTQSIHHAIRFLVDHIPENMHLVIASRMDPPLPLARLRARGLLYELRQEDLRFTLEEASQFIHEILGFALSAEDIVALTTRTEGWIAGLQMAAVSMQGRQDLSTFVRAFTGSHKFVLDYLIEEVLLRQPDPVQKFLIQTSILKRLSGPLCDAILRADVSGKDIKSAGLLASERETGSSSAVTLTTAEIPSQLILERLERENIFLVPLDDQRYWYRYHQLFAEFLNSRLEQQLPNLASVLYRRAAEWFEQNGFIQEAIENSLEGKDYEHAALWIDRIAESIFKRSEIATFFRWVNLLPEEYIQGHPNLSPYYAWALLLTGHPKDIIEAQLQNAERGTALTQARAAVLRAFIAVFQGELDLGARLSQQALAQLPEDDLFLRNVVAWNQAFFQIIHGDLIAGMRSLEYTARKSLESGNILMAVFSLSNLAELKMRLGWLKDANTLSQRAMELGKDNAGRPIPMVGTAWFVLGELLREWNRLDEAESSLKEGIRLTENWGDIMAQDGYISLARVYLARKDPERAQEAIQKAQQLANKFDATRLDDIMVAAWQARLWIDQKQIKFAQKWVEERGLSVESVQYDLFQDKAGDIATPFILRIYEYFVLARLLLIRDRPQEMLTLLEHLQEIVTEKGFKSMLVEVFLLRAEASWTLQDEEGAFNALYEALGLAEPEGYVRIFLDEGEGMSELLETMIRKRSVSNSLAFYVQKLLEAFRSEASGWGQSVPPHMPSQTESLSGLLSERELEVLRLMAAGLSNREIATRLVVAVSTVKTHINHIYDKLGVSKRTQAVARARELNLL